MAGTIKSGPYEILLRFSCEVGETFGQLRGCHRITGTYVVDDNAKITGRIEQSADQAADFPVEDLQAYLGERFVAFDAQLFDLLTELNASRSALEQAEATAASEIAARDQLIADLTEKLERASAAVPAERSA